MATYKLFVSFAIEVYEWSILLYSERPRLKMLHMAAISHVLGFWLHGKINLTIPPPVWLSPSIVVIMF